MRLAGLAILAVATISTPSIAQQITRPTVSKYESRQDCIDGSRASVGAMRALASRLETGVTINRVLEHDFNDRGWFLQVFLQERGQSMIFQTICRADGEARTTYELIR